jgi:hypothetical protein
MGTAAAKSVRRSRLNIPVDWATAYDEIIASANLIPLSLQSFLNLI